MEMDFWRHSARISRKDKIRYTITKQKMNVTKSLLDDIKTKQLHWYGHVQRMEEGRLPKEVMNWRPPGRRKQGRPKLTWAEGIKGLMGEKGLMEEDWNDRSNWRKKIIKIIKTHQQYPPTIPHTVNHPIQTHEASTQAHSRPQQKLALNTTHLSCSKKFSAPAIHRNNKAVTKLLELNIQCIYQSENNARLQQQ